MSTRVSRKTAVIVGLALLVVGAAAAAAETNSGIQGGGGTAIGGTRPAIARPRVSGPFPRLTPAPAPPGWRSTTLANGTAVLSYPPAMSRVRGDRGSASAARFSSSGGYLLYLNATPRQGGETLGNWAAYRLRFLRSDDASRALLDAHANGVHFRGGSGSCVLDDYVTKVGAHHFEELACLVQGRTGASVIVAAAPASQWPRAQPLLAQAVAAYQFR